MRVIHKKSNTILGENIKHANNMWSRMIGLMFVSEMKNKDGLLLEPGNSIHNWFVRFPIDVLFISRKNTIVGYIRGFKPWRFSKIYFKSKKVLELPAGKLPENIEIGDELEISHV